MIRFNGLVARAFATSISLLALAAIPANAGWLFGESDPPAPAVDDRTIEQIQQAIDDQRYVDAGTLLDRTVFDGKGDPRLTLLLGDLNLAKGHYDVALTSFKQVESVPAVHIRALEGEGLSMMLLGRDNDAFQALQATVSANPTAWRAWNALGVTYDRRRDWAKAGDAYEHAMSGSDGSPLVLNNRGFSRLSQGRLDEAAADFVAALQKKPDFVSARNNLRLTIAMKGDYNRAIEGGGAKDRASILNNAGYVAMTRGDYSQAKNLLGQAIRAKGEFYSVAAANLEMVHGLETGGSAGTADDHSH
jgi:Flp pilus assembly protein TadD